MSDNSRERNQKLSEDAERRIDAIRGGKEEEDEIIPDQRYYGDEERP